MTEWTEAKDRRLLDMRAAGKSFGFIGQLLNQADGVCKSRHETLICRKHLSTRPVPASRKCMGCGHEFKPAHIGEYFHPECKGRSYDDFAGVSLKRPGSPR